MDILATSISSVRRDTAPVRRGLGAVALSVAVVAWPTWFGWRISSVHLHIIPLLSVAIELVVATSGLVVAFGLLKAAQPRDVLGEQNIDSHRFAFSVADLVGRTRSTDLHRDVRVAMRSAPKRVRRSSADLTVGAVLLDGPMRLASVVMLVLALLLGVAPMTTPPTWAIVSAVVAVAAVATSHVALGRGRLLVGDRLRWSYSAMGEVLARTDHGRVAPRRWEGVVGAVVALNLAIALRGMSDRWTHGFAPMDPEGRHVTMLLALISILGGLYTLRTVTAPEIQAGLRSRRLEESTARQAAIGAAVCIGAIGLIAGIAPDGGTDATTVDRDVPAPAAGEVPDAVRSRSTLHDMAVVRLFASARDAAGTGRDELPGDTVGEVLTAARERYGATFDAVLANSRVWVNGEPAEFTDSISMADELAVLPPVSGG
jgi:molybdopterin converting factor small subunit